MGKKRKRLRDPLECSVCFITCTSVHQLWEHALGLKHKKRMVRDYPDSAPRLNSLQYFLDTFLEEYPILGLQYIVEVQEEGAYNYSCQLCGDHFISNYAIAHVTCLKHMKNYVKKHHPKEMPKNSKDNNLIQWQKLAQVIQNKCGRKRIRVVEREDEPPTPTKVSKLSPEMNDLPSKTASAGQLSKSQRRNLNKSRRMSVSSWLCQRTETAQIEMMDRMEFLQLKCNADFLDFLRTFEIHNNEDAALLRDLTHSCTAALMRFWDKQLNSELAQLSPSGCVPASTDTDRACQESDSYGLHKNMSLSHCSFHEGDDTSKLDEKRDAMEVFFSNIKDMAVSEVTADLERIAATNSAFSGINIPNVIKYLQETGRLKNT